MNQFRAALLGGLVCFGSVVLFAQSATAWPGEDDLHFVAAPEGESLFEQDNAQKMYEALSGKMGDKAQVSRVFVYPDIARVTAYKPSDGAQYAEYAYWRGETRGPTPISSMKKGADLKDIHFDFASIPFKNLSKLAESALKELPLKESKVTHLMVGKDLGYKDQTVLRFFLLGKEKEGEVFMTLGGDVLKKKDKERFKYPVNPPKRK